MKKRKRLAAALATLLCVGLLSGCGGLTVESVMDVIAPTETPKPGEDLTFSNRVERTLEPLSVTYQEMDGLFSPFWAETDGDVKIVKMTQLSLRSETADPSPGEYSRELNEDGSTTVILRLKDGICFSDGIPLTARDLLFTYYVLIDSDYDGPARVNTLPIRGLAAYWNGMDLDMYSKYITLYEQIYNNGNYDKDLKAAVETAKQEARAQGIREDVLADQPGVRAAQKALDEYDTERAEEIRAAIDDAWHADVRNLVDYTIRNYSNSIELRTRYTRDEVLANYGLQVMYTMLDRGFGTMSEDGGFTATNDKSWNLWDAYPTVDDLYDVMYEAYSGDPVKYWSIEGFGRGDMLSRVENELVLRWAPEDPDWRGTVDRVSGLEILDDRTLAVTLEYCDDTVLRILTEVFIAPLHYYGEETAFDPENNSFGITRGDLSSVRELSRASLGAGQFVYRETDVRTVYLDPNELYWLGMPEYTEAVVSKE